MKIRIYKSSRKNIFNPIVHPIGIALLITAILTAVITWIFYPSLDVFFRVLFLIVFALSFLPGVYFIYCSLMSDLNKIHLFAVDEFERLFYVTVEIPPREVQHARFPDNLGLSAVKSSVTDLFEETLNFVYSDGFDQSLSEYIMNNIDFQTQRNITISPIYKVDKILPIRGGWVIDYYSSPESKSICHAIVFRHLSGTEEIIDIATKNKQGDNNLDHASNEKKEKL